MRVRTAWWMTWMWLVLSSQTGATEVVTLAAEDDWPPYSALRADGRGPEGLSPSLVQAALKTQNVDVRFQVVPFSRCLHYAEKGTVVGCFNTTRTEANKALFHWHRTPLFQEELGIFARTPVSGRELTPQDLEGQSVGITIGYTYPTGFMQNPRINRLSAASDGNLVKMLVAGRVNFILLNTMPGYHRIQQDPALRGKIHRVGAMALDSFWISFSRVHPDGKRMSEVFEKGLQAIKANGEYERLMTSFRRDLQP